MAFNFDDMDIAMFDESPYQEADTGMCPQCGKPTDKCECTAPEMEAACKKCPKCGKAANKCECTKPETEAAEETCEKCGKPVTDCKCECGDTANMDVQEFDTSDFETADGSDDIVEEAATVTASVKSITASIEDINAELNDLVALEEFCKKAAKMFNSKSDITDDFTDLVSEYSGKITSAEFKPAMKAFKQLDVDRAMASREGWVKVFTDFANFYAGLKPEAARKSFAASADKLGSCVTESADITQEGKVDLWRPENTPGQVKASAHVAATEISDPADMKQQIRLLQKRIDECKTKIDEKREKVDDLRRVQVEEKSKIVENIVGVFIDSTEKKLYKLLKKLEKLTNQKNTMKRILSEAGINIAESASFEVADFDDSEFVQEAAAAAASKVAKAQGDVEKTASEIENDCFEFYEDLRKLIDALNNDPDVKKEFLKAAKIAPREMENSLKTIEKMSKPGSIIKEYAVMESVNLNEALIKKGKTKATKQDAKKLAQMLNNMSPEELQKFISRTDDPERKHLLSQLKNEKIKDEKESDDKNVTESYVVQEGKVTKAIMTLIDKIVTATIITATIGATSGVVAGMSTSTDGSEVYSSDSIRSKAQDVVAEKYPVDLQWALKLNSMKIHRASFAFDGNTDAANINRIADTLYGTLEAVTKHSTISNLTDSELTWLKLVDKLFDKAAIKKALKSANKGDKIELEIRVADYNNASLMVVALKIDGHYFDAKGNKLGRADVTTLDDLTTSTLNYAFEIDAPRKEVRNIIKAVLADVKELGGDQTEFNEYAVDEEDEEYAVMEADESAEHLLSNNHKIEQKIQKLESELNRLYVILTRLTDVTRGYTDSPESTNTVVRKLTRTSLNAVLNKIKKIENKIEKLKGQLAVTNSTIKEAYELYDFDDSEFVQESVFNKPDSERFCNNLDKVMSNMIKRKNCLPKDVDAAIKFFNEEGKNTKVDKLLNSIESDKDTIDNYTKEKLFKITTSSDRYIYMQMETTARMCMLFLQTEQKIIATYGKAVHDGNVSDMGIRRYLNAYDTAIESFKKANITMTKSFDYLKNIATDTRVVMIDGKKQLAMESCIDIDELFDEFFTSEEYELSEEELVTEFDVSGNVDAVRQSLVKASREMDDFDDSTKNVHLLDADTKKKIRKMADDLASMLNEYDALKKAYIKKLAEEQKNK